VPRHILDTGVVVELAQADAFSLLGGLAPDVPCLEPDEVDAELQKGKTNHPVDFGRYQDAISDGRLAVLPVTVGSPEHAEFLKLRATRTSLRGTEARMPASQLPWRMVLTGYI